jgi:hypothetical protein
MKSITLALSRGWRFGLLGLALYSCVTVYCFAQPAAPPALGPSTFRSDKTQLAISVIVAIARTKVAEIVAQTNDKIHKQTGTVSVEALPIQVFGPRRVASQYTNRPNEFYVKVPLIIAVKVKIPLASDRTISIPLDVNFFCEGWHTGKGNLEIVAKTDRAIVEGGNIVEDVIRVRDIIDGLIKSQLTIPGGFPVPSLPISSCVTIGASPGRFVGDPDAFIAYDQPLGLPLSNLAQPTEITVALQRLKRLRARNKGAILYQDTENILLETYANFATRQSTVLTMREDDEVNLNSLVLKTPRFGQLVIIANIRHQPTGQPEDSAFATFGATANFSPGTHTLQISKVFTEPPGPTHSKPLQIRVPAYELTYTVAVVNRGTRITRTP